MWKSAGGVGARFGLLNDLIETLIAAVQVVIVGIQKLGDIRRFCRAAQGGVHPGDARELPQGQVVLVLRAQSNAQTVGESSAVLEDGAPHTKAKFKP